VLLLLPAAHPHTPPSQVHISLLAARGPRYLAALTTDRGGPRSPDWLNKLAYAWGQYIGPAVQRQQQLPSAVASLDAKTKGMPASAPATSGASELSSAQLAAEVLATLQADPPHGEPAPGPAPSPDHPPSLLPQGLLRLSLRPQPSTHYPLAPAAGTSVVQVGGVRGRGIHRGALMVHFLAAVPLEHCW
jgi:hypothetical protein